MNQRQLKVGDIVRYVYTAKSSWGANEEEQHKYDTEKNKKYIGNLGIIVNASGNRYAIDTWVKDKPLPKHAWYDRSEIEWVSSDERGEDGLYNSPPKINPEMKGLGI